MGRLAQLTGERLVRALVRLGWTVARQSGSHVILTCPGRNPVTVPVHRGRTLKEGTARGIIKSAGLTEAQLFKVYLGPRIMSAALELIPSLLHLLHAACDSFVSRSPIARTGPAQLTRLTVNPQTIRPLSAPLHATVSGPDSTR